MEVTVQIKVIPPDFEIVEAFIKEHRPHLCCCYVKVEKLEIGAERIDFVDGHHVLRFFLHCPACGKRVWANGD